MNYSKQILAVTIALVLSLGIISVARQNNSNQESTVELDAGTLQPGGMPLMPSQDTMQDMMNSDEAQSTEDLLLYMIEEEKLAHDVYTVMYEKYGAKVFGNIIKSESTHQARVLTLLQARSIPDPRSDQIGVFDNQELQEFYNTLIAQGEISANEAYKVGVAIEEKDIADISMQLEMATDQDVITTLEALRSASENHLRAFNRQL